MHVPRQQCAAGTHDNPLRSLGGRTTRADMGRVKQKWKIGSWRRNRWWTWGDGVGREISSAGTARDIPAAYARGHEKTGCRRGRSSSLSSSFEKSSSSSSIVAASSSSSSSSPTTVSSSTSFASSSRSTCRCGGPAGNGSTWAPPTATLAWRIGAAAAAEGAMSAVAGAARDG